MYGMCGALCDGCEFIKSKNCKGCKNTNGCPFGKKCWIAKYIEIGGEEKYKDFKKELIDEFNTLHIDGLPKIDELYPLCGEFINLEYTLPNGEKVKILSNDESYLGNQVECEFNNDIIKKN